MTDFAEQPLKMTMMNMVTSDILEPMFNPETLEEVISVNYSTGQVPGYSQAIEQFLNTDSCKYNFELFYTSIGKGREGQKKLDADRLFLISLAHPHRSESVRRGGPPRVLFVWPNLLSLTCIVKPGMTFTHSQFNKQLGSTAWRVKLQLTEVRDVFVGMEDILATGTNTTTFL